MRQGAGTEHLVVVARGPRAAGSEGERTAQEYAAGVLRAAGFQVSSERFEYSALPGRLGTPVGGALALLTALATGWVATAHDSPRAAGLVFLAGVALLAGWARRMLGDGVLTLPVMRTSADNLVARRGATEPRVWLVAHLDSKSQPVPSAFRVAGIVLLAVGLLVTLAALLLTLGGGMHRTLWWVAAAASVAGAFPTVLALVGNDSDGAVDNASGVAAVLAAATRLSPNAEVGVLMPSAEELGLAGARAWVRGRAGAESIALNCDGVDDEGALTIMYSGHMPRTLVAALEEAAETPLRVRRLPLGLLTDSVAFTAARWQSVTVSRGSLATLRRVHTRGDSLANLRGDGIDEVSGLLARAAEALAR
jgi:Peptidase family M28